MLKTGDKKLIHAWAFYDWANSVYSLVISTAVFPLYYTAITDGKSISFLGINWQHPDTLYSYSLSFSFLIVALLSPVLSAIADYTGNKKKFLQIFCAIGSFSTMCLYFFKDEDTVWIGLTCSILASIGFWGSIVFYNAYLPEVAPPEKQDQVSAKGFIYGYAGSVILLTLNLLMIQSPDTFGITTGMASRISFLMVGLWWIGFAQITFSKLPNNVFNKKPDKNYIWKGFRELNKVWRKMQHYPTLRGFLITFFLLSIGVQTVILLASIFGASLGLQTSHLIITILVVQLLAIFGAGIFSRISRKLGNLTALKIILLIWILVCLGAFLLQKGQPHVDIYFYILGGCLGMVLGAIQFLSRSTYSKLLPETEEHATYFSFYDVAEKISIVIGTFMFGLLTKLTGSMQWSILSLIIFFISALIVLNTLKSTKHVK